MSVEKVPHKYSTVSRWCLPPVCSFFVGDALSGVWALPCSRTGHLLGKRMTWFTGCQSHHLCTPGRQAVAGSPEFSRAPVAPMLLQSARALSEFSRAPVATMLLQSARPLPRAFFFAYLANLLGHSVGQLPALVPCARCHNSASSVSAPPPARQMRAMRNGREGRCKRRFEPHVCVCVVVATASSTDMVLFLCARQCTLSRAAHT